VSPAIEAMPRIPWPDDDGPPPFGRGAEPIPGHAVISHLRRGNDLDVYDAWSEERASRCVLKVPRPDRLDDDSVIARLEEEGRLLLSLAHPHIVRAYAWAPAPVPALVLETLGGETLSHLIDRTVGEGDAPVGEDLAQLGLQLGAAASYMHRRGVLHLDLKPSNVIVEAGRAKLLDLSLARAPGAAPEGIGTWCYLAPEQARGESLGPAADVWGIGATLYEAATALPPFDEPGDDEDGFPQLDRRARRIDAERPFPAGLVDAVAACLEPDAARRPALTELMATLERESGLPADERRWG
jgi:eukaryotic-like serine/threonine-protein kinase